MDFIRNTWSDIRGNVKYDVIKWAIFAGTAVLTAVGYKWIQHLRHVTFQDPIGYIILAALVFIALTLCGLSSVLGAGGSRRDRPKFGLTLGAIVWQYREDKDLTVFYMLASVINRGEPSVTLCWKGTYAIGKSSENMEMFHILDTITIAVDGEVLSLTNDSLVNLRTSEASIQRGQLVGGRLLFTVPGDRTAQIKSLFYTIEVECQDYLGNISTATYRPSSVPTKVLLGHYREKREFIIDEPERAMPPLLASDIPIRELPPISS